MSLQIVRNDITKMEVDAIVNSANTDLLGGGGADGAIHKAAGPKLLEECKTLGGCKTGEAKITGGYNLNAKFVIHTVGPIWNGGNNNEEKKLRSCYTNSLILARDNNLESIAFPIISSGIYGYPKDEALRIAREEITRFLYENEMMVYLVVYDPSTFSISKELFDDVKQYIDDNFVDTNSSAFYSKRTPLNNYSASIAPNEFKEEKKQRKRILKRRKEKIQTEILEDRSEETFQQIDIAPVFVCENRIEPKGLSDIILDESFSQMILRKIDEKGWEKDSICYKRANIDRKLFSKIRSDINYQPSKQTACAFIFALELQENEANELLEKAGYALSKSKMFDVIIKFAIENKIDNVFEVNEILFDCDQPTLGSK